MFETAVLSYDPPTKRVWATFAGFTGQAALIGFALLAPMLWPQVIPRVAWSVQVVGPPPPPPPPPPKGPSVAQHAHVIPVQTQGTQFYIPRVIPLVAQLIVDPEDLPAGTSVSNGVVGGTEGGDPNGIIGGILAQTPRVVPVIKQPEPVKTAATAVTPAPVAAKPIRISELQLATPIHKVEPIYPVLAKQAHIQGTVQLLGVLGTDGRIHELRVVSGHPLLITAAMDAVKQWVFAPTILNGQAVEVQAPIQVNFVLNR
jgi:protein TonB